VEEVCCSTVIVVSSLATASKAVLAWRHADSRRKQSGNVTEAGR
jgi:hypothetical protein